MSMLRNNCPVGGGLHEYEDPTDTQHTALTGNFESDDEVEEIDDEGEGSMVGIHRYQRSQGLEEGSSADVDSSKAVEKSMKEEPGSTKSKKKDRKGKKEKDGKRRENSETDYAFFLQGDGSMGSSHIPPSASSQTLSRSFDSSPSSSFTVSSSPSLHRPPGLVLKVDIDSSAIGLQGLSSSSPLNKKLVMHKGKCVRCFDVYDTISDCSKCGQGFCEQCRGESKQCDVGDHKYEMVEIAECSKCCGVGEEVPWECSKCRLPYCASCRKLSKMRNMCSSGGAHSYIEH